MDLENREGPPVRSGMTNIATRLRASTSAPATADPPVNRGGGRPGLAWAEPAGAAVLSAVVILWPWLSGSLYYKTVAIQMFIYISLAVSYQLLLGNARLVSFAHVAFYGLSAYTVVILVSRYHIPFVAAWLAGIALAVVVAFFVGSLVIKLEPLLLAVSTLAVAEVLLTVVSTLGITGGQNGLVTRPFSLGRVERLTFSYWFVAVGMLLVVGVTVFVSRSALGRLLLAVGDDTVAARSVGVSSSRTLISAFVLCSGLAAVAGIMLAQSAVVLSPGDIDLNAAITVLAMVAVGGIRSMFGAALGAILLTLIPVWFASIAQDESLIYGGILLAVFVLAPGGLVSLVSPVRRALVRSR